MNSCFNNDMKSLSDIKFLYKKDVDRLKNVKIGEFVHISFDRGKNGYVGILSITVDPYEVYMNYLNNGGSWEFWEMTKERKKVLNKILDIREKKHV